MYGAGLYFAESQGVIDYMLEGMKRRHGDAGITYNGEPAERYAGLWDAVDEFRGTPEMRAAGFVAARIGRNATHVTEAHRKRALTIIDVKMESIRDEKANLEKRLGKAPSSIEFSMNTLDEFRAAVEAVDLKQIKIVSPGRVIEADLRPADEDYLLWDKPLSEQSDKVKAVLDDLPDHLKKKLNTVIERQGGEIGDIKAASFYKFLEQNWDWLDTAPKGHHWEKSTSIRGTAVQHDLTRDDGTHVASATLKHQALKSAGYAPDMIASMWLNEHGIAGNKYLDEGSRAGAQDKTPFSFEDWLGTNFDKDPMDIVGTPDEAKFDALYESYVETFETGPTYNYVVFDAEQIDIVNMNQDARGSITFGPEGTLMRLGKNRDRSTFIHETGHMWLQQLKTDSAVNEKRAGMFSTITKWMGDNSASLKAEAIVYAKEAGQDQAVIDLQAMTDAQVKEYIAKGDLTGGGFVYPGRFGKNVTASQQLSRAMHEQFARGTEHYFATGQAPSVGLMDAFRHFKAWLSTIYKNLKSRGLDVQFSPEVKSVMDHILASDEDIALVAEQYNMKPFFETGAEVGMTPSQLERYQRMHVEQMEQAKADQLAKRIKQDQRIKEKAWQDDAKVVREAVEPVIWDMREYRLIHEIAHSELPNGEPLGTETSRLDRKAVMALIGAEGMAKLPRVRNKQIYAAKDGSDPALVASMYGWESAEQMLDDLMNAPPMEQAIQDETKRRMDETHGNINAIPGEAAEEAIESTQNDKRGEMLVHELNLVKESGPMMKAAFIRNWAKEKIGGHVVDEVKAQAYLSAQKKHGRAAGKALKAGDRLLAQREKFQEVMNFYMAQESYRVRAEIDKGRAYARNLTSARHNFKTIEPGYVERLQQILGNYGFGPRLSETKRANLMEWAAAQTEEGAIMDIPERILREDNTTHYRDLTVDEFRTLIDSVKTIEAQGRALKSTMIAGERMYIDDMSGEIVASLSKHPDNARQARTAREQSPGTTDRWRHNVRSADAYLRKMEFIFKDFDGEMNGAMHRSLFQPFADAEVESQDITKSVTIPVMDAMKAIPKDIVKQMNKKVYVADMDRSFLRSELIMMALNMGTENNYWKMVDGSMKDNGVAWTEESVEAAVAVLEPAEWAFVQSVWDAFDTMLPGVKAVYRAENGRALEAVPGRTFENRHGQTMQGKYFPMMYDPRRGDAGATIERKSALEAMQSSMVRSSVFEGMTKARTGFSAPVNLDIAALLPHIEKTAHYISHYDAVRVTRKLLARPEVSGAMTAKMGPEYYQSIKDWMGDIATNGHPADPTSKMGRFIEHMRSNVTIAIMGLSYTTTAIQVVGLTQSIDAMAQTPDGRYNQLEGAKWMMEGYSQYLANPNDAINWVTEISGEMRHRMANTDRDVRRGLRDVKKGPMAGKTDNLREFSLMGIAAAQVYAVDYPTFIGAFNQAIAAGMTEKEAVRRAESVIRMSQTAGGTKDLSAVQREKGMINAVTMFYSFFNLLYNIEHEIVSDVKTVKDVPRAAARVALLLVATQMFESLMRWEWPDDDENYLWFMAKKASVFGLSSMPVVRDAAGMIEGYDFQASPIEGVGKSLKDTVVGISKDIDNGTVSAKTLKSAVSLLGMSRGLPATSVNRIISTVDGILDDENIHYGYDFLVGHRKEK